MQLVKPGTNFDFVGKRYIAGVLSALMVIASILVFIFVGPNWGIDFTGGTEVTLDFDESNPVEIAEVRSVLSGLEVGNDAVQQIGAAEDDIYVIRIQDPTFGTDGLRDELLAALTASFGADWIAESSFDVQVGARLTVRYTGEEVPLKRIQDAVGSINDATASKSPDDNVIYIKVPGVGQQVGRTVLAAFDNSGSATWDDKTLQGVGTVASAETIGPRVGGDLRRQGFIAIAATLALVLVYVAFRFEFAFAPGAVLALMHDVTIVVGIFTLTRHEFNLSMIGALLTIIGYSLNDTIVIYDRIRENMRRYRRGDTENLINSSINETLNRTLATSLTTAMAMLAFLFLGGPVIETFALAILLGVIFGTYSTVYVATPMILVTQDLRPVLERMVAPLAAEGGESSEARPEEKTDDDQPMSAAERRRRERRERREAAKDATT